MISLKSQGTDDEEFENELKKDLYKELEHVKTDDSCVEPIGQDAETIEKETKKKRMMNFLNLF